MNKRAVMLLEKTSFSDKNSQFGPQRSLFLLKQEALRAC